MSDIFVHDPSTTMPEKCCRLAVHQGQSVLYNINANINQVKKYALLAKENKADIIVFNELFLHGYELKYEHFLRQLRSTAFTSSSSEMQLIADIARSIGKNNDYNDGNDNNDDDNDNDNGIG